VAPGVEGLVRISKLANRHVARASDVVATNQRVLVSVLAIDRAGRKISLSIRDA
jgi:small subunit ribosomal protein S1